MQHEANGLTMPPGGTQAVERSAPSTPSTDDITQEVAVADESTPPAAPPACRRKRKLGKAECVLLQAASQLDHENIGLMDRNAKLAGGAACVGGKTNCVGGKLAASDDSTTEFTKKPRKTKAKAASTSKQPKALVKSQEQHEARDKKPADNVQKYTDEQSQLIVRSSTAEVGESGPGGSGALSQPSVAASSAVAVPPNSNRACRNIASEIRIYVRAITKQLMVREIFKPMKTPWDAPPEYWKHFTPKSPDGEVLDFTPRGTRSAEFLADTQMALQFAYTYFRKEHMLLDRLSADLDTDAFCTCLRGPVLRGPHTQDSFLRGPHTKDIFKQGPWSNGVRFPSVIDRHAKCTKGTGKKLADEIIAHYSPMLCGASTSVVQQATM